ncbi:hypothetical protein [Eudoraea sp.]|uniref:hypothetical protein n=1 Tax=Eudoraea sp. TaxID=1979955 RepID=UPI003C716663
MKTIDNFIKKPLLALAILAVLIIPYSCTDDEPITSLTEKVEAEEEKETEEVKEINYVLTELATGAALNGANGLDIGVDGNLYIGSVIGLEIVVMNKDNGTIINRIGREMGVNGADDVVFGPDGSLYWTDILIGEVGKMTPEGVVTKQFVAPGVNPINFSPEGRLFVALDFLGDGLYELDPDLIEPPRPIVVATPENPFPLGFLNAFDFCSDGRLYGPLFAAGLVIRVDVGNPGDPVSTDPFGDGIAEVVATGFEHPAAAKFDSKEVLHVVDQTGEVFKININTGEKTLFTTLDRGLDNLTFDEDDALYMTNNDLGWVAEILPSGAARTISPGGMVAPQGLAVLTGSDNQDALFVADQYSLIELNAVNGEQENIYRGYLIPGEGDLTTPQNVSADGNNLIISAWFSGLVQVWDPQANMILESYAMGVPIDVIRFKNDLIVSDLGLGGVVWASDNSMILPIDNATVFAPSGLATDGETVWVADWGTGLVWQIDFEGNIPGTPFPIASDLMNPEGLALDLEGNLLVVETGASRLSKIDLATGEVTTIVEGLELSDPGLEGLPPTWGFDGVAVGSTGAIYISGGGANVVYRVTQE